eukprot:7377995-Prymnesium_polylepis.1
MQNAMTICAFSEFFWLRIFLAAGAVWRCAYTCAIAAKTSREHRVMFGAAEPDVGRVHVSTVARALSRPCTRCSRPAGRPRHGLQWPRLRLARGRRRVDGPAPKAAQCYRVKRIVARLHGTCFCTRRERRRASTRIEESCDSRVRGSHGAPSPPNKISMPGDETLCSNRDRQLSFCLFLPGLPAAG